MLKNKDGLTYRLIFNMGIPIHVKDGLYIETGPRWYHDSYFYISYNGNPYT